MFAFYLDVHTSLQVYTFIHINIIVFSFRWHVYFIVMFLNAGTVLVARAYVYNCTRVI